MPNAHEDGPNTHDERLPLPTELALLLHDEFGMPYPIPRRAHVIAVAELGELGLRGRISIDSKLIRVLDSAPTGALGPDATLAELSRTRRRMDDRVPLRKWVEKQQHAFEHHRDVLVQRGLLVPTRHKVLGMFSSERHVPAGPARERILDELRARARHGPPVGTRGALFAGLVQGSDLFRMIGLTDAETIGLHSIAREAHIPAKQLDLDPLIDVADLLELLPTFTLGGGGDGGGDGGG